MSIIGSFAVFERTDLWNFIIAWKYIIGLYYQPDDQNYEYDDYHNYRVMVTSHATHCDPGCYTAFKAIV